GVRLREGPKARQGRDAEPEQHEEREHERQESAPRPPGGPDRAQREAPAGARDERGVHAGASPPPSSRNTSSSERPVSPPRSSASVPAATTRPARRIKIRSQSRSATSSRCVLTSTPP